ncbi:MAG: hypothetical protein QGG55_00940, partial [Verrucomicrobiota bacterium]|nr:hypothetical protein [Verrucomicrobiota bacterium]
ARLYMKLAKAAYHDSGLSSIDGFGASSFDTGTGIKRHAVMIHRDPAKGDGLMWKALGTAPHDLGGLKLMPADTAYAIHGDFDLPGTIDWFKIFALRNLSLKQSSLLLGVLQEMNKEAGVDLEKIIGTHDGEVGMYITLNPNKMIDLDPQMMEMFLGGRRDYDTSAPMKPMEANASSSDFDGEDTGGDAGGFSVPDPEGPGFDHNTTQTQVEPPRRFDDAPPAPKGFEEGFDPDAKQIELPRESRNFATPASKGIERDFNPAEKQAEPSRRFNEEQLVPKGKRKFAGDDPDFEGLVAVEEFRGRDRDMPSIKVPEPGFVLVLKVKDDTLQNLVNPLLQQIEAQTQQVGGATLHTIPVPPGGPPVSLSPTLMRTGNYLVFTSTVDLAKEIVAVQGGQGPGLAGSEEFKKLTQDLDLKGNMITFTTGRIGQYFGDIFGKMMEMESGGDIPKGVQDWMGDLFSTGISSQVSLLKVMDEGYLIQNRTTGSMPMDPVIGVAIAAVPLAVAAAASAPSVLPEIERSKARANRIKSINNMRQITRALHNYADENGGKLPPADKWCDAIMRVVGSPMVFVSPLDQDAIAQSRTGKKVSSYAFNAALAGKSLHELDHRTVLVFECNLGWNGSGGLKDLHKNVPPDQWNVALVSGDSQLTNPNHMQRSQMRWSPPKRRNTGGKAEGGDTGN